MRPPLELTAAAVADDMDGAGEAGIEPVLGGGNGMGMEDAVMMERSAASCESRCSVGSMGSKGSRKELCADDDGVGTSLELDAGGADWYKLGVDSMMTVFMESERVMG